jgi:hypothetical protein
VERYITQLIADLREVANKPPQPPDFDIPEGLEHLRNVYEWEHAAEKPMREWFGISTDIFPDEQKLTGKQVELLVEELINLWEAYNFLPELPEDLPVRLKYKLMTGYLDKPVKWVSDGMTHIGFCHYDPDECPFPEAFCKCKNRNAEIDFEFNDMAEIPPGNANLIKWLKWNLEYYPQKDYHKLPEFIGMEHYCKQLLEDFTDSAKRARKNFTSFEDPFESDMRIAYELVHSSFVTLEELTGIKKVCLPEDFNMHCYHTCTILIGMIKMLDAYDIEVIYPAGVPPEIFYEALRINWDDYMIRHMPNTGDEIDLCTEEVNTCPFALYCKCEDAVRMQISEGIIHKEVINQKKDYQSSEEDDVIPF